ncbi:uncharacterized protein LOC132265113 [Phlebotomus argentipes]|uniref:uncharacterized protein LOC132265113 n=1 Tax=Phlebotomus argentipes TaxID=94469 RepID=UPI002893047C|nr:uncharacterized protein LOC132265113 [Phlebotomus argentipes]
MTKKSSPRNKEWEKDRRDRLNKTFDSLARKLPQYDPSSPFSKIEILQRTISFIEELQKKQKDLLLSECDKVLLKEREEFEQNINVLRSRNSQLAELLRQAGITIPNFKAQKFAGNLSDKQIESLLEENNANGLNVKPEKQKKYSNKLSSEQISKVVKENEDKGRKSAKKFSKTKTSPEKVDKKPARSKVSKAKEKNAEEKPPVAVSLATTALSSALVSFTEGQKAAKTTTISAISSKNVTITHTSLTRPIMATGLFLPVPVVQAPAQPLLIVNTGRVPAPIAKVNPKIGKRKGKGRWLQIQPHPVPARIPFGKIPIPALKSNFIKKKKRIMRKRICVKDDKTPAKKRKVGVKRKSEEKIEKISKKSKSETTMEKDNGKIDSRKTPEDKIEEEQKSRDKIEKTVTEIITEPQDISAPLSHSDLSNDIFASLQVPSGGSNTGCLSPTAAFLMTFPVVSSAGGGKNPETVMSEDSPGNSGNVTNQAVETGKEDQEAENSSVLLDNLSSLFGTRDDYTGLYSTENLEKTPQKHSEKISTDSAVVPNPIRIRTDMGAIPQKTMDTQIPTSFTETFSSFDYSLSNNCGSKINSSVFPSYTAIPLLPEMAPVVSTTNATKCEFTFSLTKTSSTAPCSSYKADTLYNPFSFASTSSSNSVINSSCPPVPPMDTNLGLPLPLNISSSIYSNVQDDVSNKTQGSFTFSLTNTTSAPSYYSKSSTNLNISFPGNDSYNTYNPFSFNDPVGIKQTSDTSTNFSFCLTSSTGKTAPIYTSTSSYNTLNPFSIDATLQTSNYRQQNFESAKNYQFYPSQGQKQPSQKPQSNKYQQKDASRTQNVQQHQKSPAKKTQNQQSKYHNVNWMTNSDYQGKSNDFHIPPPLDFTHTPNHAASTFTYPPPPPPTLGTIDLKSKSDIFFAHPPEESFSWSPNKLSNVLEPPAIHNYMPQTALPTLHGDLALSTTTPSAVISHEPQKEKNPVQNSLEGYQEQQQQQQQPGNFLSVSQLLVEQNKKGKKTKQIKNVDDTARKSMKQEKKQFHCMNPPGNYSDQTLNYSDTVRGNQYSNIYSAESLIGYNSKKDKASGQQNYHQASLDLPSSGGNLFPGIELNNDINYNSNILFNPPTSSTFVPPPQNCMSMFPENDFYDYSGKAGGPSKSGQQQNAYYFNKSHQNGLPPMDYTAHKGDAKATNSPSFLGNKFNNVQSTSVVKTKKTPSAKIPDFYPPPPPPPSIHPNIGNYDSSVPSSNYFSVPLGVNSPHLPPAEEPFHLHLNYSNTLKTLAPSNSSLYLPEGSNVSNPSNSLTNFHLSSICPEINDKVRQQNW